MYNILVINKESLMCTDFCVDCLLCWRGRKL